MMEEIVETRFELDAERPRRNSGEMTLGPDGESFQKRGNTEQIAHIVKIQRLASLSLIGDELLLGIRLVPAAMR